MGGKKKEPLNDSQKDYIERNYKKLTLRILGRKTEASVLQVRTHLISLGFLKRALPGTGPRREYYLRQKENKQGPQFF